MHISHIHMLYPIPPKLFAKSKRNSTWKVHLYFHGMQEVIFCCTYTLFISLAIIVLFYFFFSLSMAGQGKGRGRGRGSKMPLSQGDTKGRPRKGRILNDWNTDDMERAINEFNQQMQVSN